MTHAAVGPEEQRRWQTTRRNEKAKPKWDPVKSKLSRIRSESDRIGKVLRFEWALLLWHFAIQEPPTPVNKNLTMKAYGR